MNRRKMIVWGVGAFALLLLLVNTFYVVGQREQALVLRLGEPVRVVNVTGSPSPGLKLKAPFVENVVKFDKRNLSLESDEEEIIAQDQERLVVDAFVRYRISDPLQFFRTLRDQRIAADRLERLTNSSLREVLGSAPSNDIISGQRGELMRRTRDLMIRNATASRLGVQIIDVRIKRADLPTQNQEAVYRRMETARQQEAATIRANGERRKRESREQPARELDLERSPEERAQLPPRSRLGVAEAVLGQRLLDGEVEQHLEEPGSDERRREDAELDERERVRRDDRGDDPEGRRGVEAGGGRRPAPEKPRPHFRTPV